MEEMTKCQECGMPVKDGEFHPYAACLMYKACHSPEDVRGNIAALYQHGYTDGHCAGRKEAEGKLKEAEALLRGASLTIEAIEKLVPNWTAYRDLPEAVEMALSQNL